MRSGLQKIFLSLFLLTGYCVHAQVKFSATISPSEIGKNEYAQLKLMVENAREVTQIVPPNLGNFIIVSGPNQESGMTMINGTVKKYIALNFILKPKTTGVFTIPASLAKADAGDYKSNTVKLRVTAKSTGNTTGGNGFNSPFSGMDPFAEPAPRSSYNDFILRKGENPVDKIKRNMLVRVEIDKKSCYVGEPVVATYKLYTRLKSESNMIKNPSFNGFSVLDLQQPNDMSYHVEKFEGREYNVYNIRKVQLYPLLAGNLELGIVEIENNVQFIKAEYIDRQPDVFDMFRDLSSLNIPPEGMEIQKVSLQSKPVTVLVKPLPGENKPAGYKGAVGRFAVDARVEKNNFSTDDAGNLAIIISGEGNLQMINAPEISWPAGIEGFDPKATDDLFKGTVPVSGRKIFEFPFTVSKAGTYSFPAMTFSFFDTRDAKYKTVTTAPLQITVTKGTGKPPQINVDRKAKPVQNYLAKFFSNRLRVVSVIAVLIILGLIFWLKRDSKKEKQSAEEQLLKQELLDAEKPVEEILQAQQNPLALAEECLQRQDGRPDDTVGRVNLFYTQLNLGLKNYLSKKFAISAEELNRKNIVERLDAKGVSNETAVQLQQLLDDIEWQLYTPYVNNEKMQELYDQTADMIQLLDTYKS
ncbi:MAG: BatD family protein [Ferruginibacter sp.]